MREYYKNVFNIPASASFWDNLATVYLKKFEDNKLNLASVLFLVANRRNCQSLINDIKTSEKTKKYTDGG